MSTKTICAIVITVCGVTVYQASNWWERAYATYVSSETSPDGCIRIDTYKPFWVLPSVFHRIPDPDPTVRYSLGMPWDYPIFDRAYETSTGILLGETIVYDPAGHNFVDWGDPRQHGRRVVEVNGFALVDSDRCADEVTLARLKAYHETKRQTARIAPEAHRPKESPPSSSQ